MPVATTVKATRTVRPRAVSPMRPKLLPHRRRTPETTEAANLSVRGLDHMLVWGSQMQVRVPIRRLIPPTFLDFSTDFIQNRKTISVVPLWPSFGRVWWHQRSSSQTMNLAFRWQDAFCGDSVKLCRFIPPTFCELQK
jgi:hypothetical protein